MTQRLVSVVVPVFNEELVIREFYGRASAVLNGLPEDLDHELVFVDDGSSDGSPGILAELAAQDEHVRVLTLSRNFGHQLAITAGMDEARGDAAVVMDADLQDPPEVIVDMVGQWREGYHVVYGVRTQRKGETGFKVTTAKWFYRLLNRLADVPLPVDSGDFRLIDRAVLDVLSDIREENRYVRGLVSWAGFTQTAVQYQRDARYAGETKYTLTKMLRFAMNALTSFSEKPLRLSLQLGSLVTVGAFLLAATIIIGRLVQPERSFPGYASLLVIVLFLGGVQLLTIGLLGEYVGRIYRESKNRPLYVIARRVGGRADAPPHEPTADGNAAPPHSGVPSAQSRQR